MLTFALICLSIWNIPLGLKFVAYYLGGFSGMASPILYSFVNTSLAESYGERGLVISSMMTLGFSCTIWVPLLIFPTVEAPRWKKGFPAALVFEVAMWAIFIFGVWYMARYKLRQNRSDEEGRLDAASGTETPLDEKRELESESGSGSLTPVEVVAAQLETAESRVGK
jgi:hypothetical protein